MKSCISNGSQGFISSAPRRVFRGILGGVLFGARAARFSPPIDNGKTDGIEQERKCQNNEIDFLVQGNGKGNDGGRHHPHKNLAQQTIRPVRNTSRGPSATRREVCTWE